jgi:hypothetical protein
MIEEIQDRVRDAIMDTFRKWGGQWNVTPHSPEAEEGPADAWSIRVHSRHIARGTLPVEVVEAYLEDSADPEAAAAWESALRPIFEAARADGND